MKNINDELNCSVMDHAVPSIFGEFTNYKRMEMDIENIIKVFGDIFRSSISSLKHQIKLKDVKVTYSRNRVSFEAPIPADHRDSIFGQLKISFKATAEGDIPADGVIVIYIPELIDGVYFIINGKRYNTSVQALDVLPYNKGSKNGSSSLVIKTLFAPIEVKKTIKKRSNIKVINKLMFNSNGEMRTDDDYNTFWYLDIFKSLERNVLLYYFPVKGFRNTLIKFGIDPADFKIGIFEDFSKIEKKLSEFTSPYYDSIYFVNNTKKNTKKKIYVKIPRNRNYTKYYLSIINTLADALYGITDLEEFERVLNTEDESDMWYNLISNYHMPSKLSNPVEKLTNTTNGLMKLGDDITKQVFNPFIKKGNGSLYDVFDFILFTIIKYSTLKAKSNNMKNFGTKRFRFLEYISVPYILELSTKINRIVISKIKPNNTTLVKQLAFKSASLILDSIRRGEDKNSNIVSISNTGIDALVPHTLLGKQGLSANRLEAIPKEFFGNDATEAGIIDLTRSSAKTPGLKGGMVPAVNMSDINHGLSQHIIDKYRNRFKKR